MRGREGLDDAVVLELELSEERDLWWFEHRRRGAVERGRRPRLRRSEQAETVGEAHQYRVAPGGSTVPRDCEGRRRERAHRGKVEPGRAARKERQHHVVGQV